MFSNIKAILLRAAFIFILSGVVGVGFNYIYPRGINPFRLPPPPVSVDSNPDTSNFDSSSKEHHDHEGVTFISTEEAFNRYELGEAIFVDCRDEHELQEGIIPGALHVSAHAFERGRPETLSYIPEDAEVILYCNGPRCPLAEEAARYFVDYGYSNLYIFKGGWDEWTEKQYPVDTSDRGEGSGE
jgi:rhodanese-related sulfurtransferase